MQALKEWLADRLSKMLLCFLDGGPEAEIHRPEDDQASFDMKGVEDSFQHRRKGIKKPIHFPEPFLKFFDSHSFGLKDHCRHIVFRPILGQKPCLLFQPLIDPSPRERGEKRKERPFHSVSFGKLQKIIKHRGIIVVIAKDKGTIDSDAGVVESLDPILVGFNSVDALSHEV